MPNAVSSARSEVACRGLVIRTDRSLLTDFTCECRPGGITWLVGTNGSGKSSLLRVLAGWQGASGGSVSWRGPAARRLFYFYPAMSAGADLRVQDFISMISSLSDASDSDVESLFPESAGAAKRFGQLSTGEAKRILLWGLLRFGTGPLLLDEPYEHLSRDAKTTLTAILRKRAGHDVVIVATNQEIPTHDTDAVLAFNGDRIEVAYG